MCGHVWLWMDTSPQANSSCTCARCGPAAWVHACIMRHVADHLKGLHASWKTALHNQVMLLKRVAQREACVCLHAWACAQVLQDPSFGEQRAAVGARVYAHFDAMLGARIEQAIRLKQAAMLQARQASQPPGQTTLQPVLAQHAAQSSAAASGADLAPSPTYPPAGPAVPNYPPSSSPCDLQNHAGQLSSGAGPAPLSTSPSESAPAQLGSSRQFLDNTASVYHSSISAPDASLHVDHASDSRPSRADMGQASDPTYKRTREDSPAGEQWQCETIMACTH